MSEQLWPDERIEKLEGVPSGAEDMIAILMRGMAKREARIAELESKLAATSADSVAALVSNERIDVRLESGTARLFRFAPPDGFIVSKNTYVIWRGTDEAAAVRAFREAAGMEVSE